MSKEFDIVEMNTEINESTVERSVIQLSELNLTLVGGGDATVAF